MNKRFFLLFLLIAADIHLLNAQITNTVTFKADITELLTQGFTPGTHTLRVEGLNWDNGNIAVSGDRNMAQDPNNLNTYVAVLNISGDANTHIGDSARYKFKGGPDNAFVNGGWESGDPVSGYDGRAFVFQANGSTIILTPASPRLEMIQTGSGLQNTVTFVADLTQIYGSGTGYFDPSRGDIIEVKGFWGNNADTNIVDGFLVSGNPVMAADPFNPKFYSTTLTIGIPAGNQPGKGTGFKFKASPDDHFSNTGWEVTANRNYYFGADDTTVTLAAIQPSISPAAGPLTNSMTALYQVNLVEGSLNRFDNSVIPRSQVPFCILKGAAPALGNWQGSWTLTDTAQAVILNDAGLDGDKIAGDHIFSSRVTFAAGTATGLSPYKYGAYYPGCESVAGVSGNYLDNSAPSGADFSFYIRESSSVLEVLNTWPTVVSSVERIPGEAPASYSLDQNYPNPFNPETRIRYTLPVSCVVKLDVYNAMGEHAAQLLNAGQSAGTYELTFSPANLASGMYFYTLTGDNFRAVKKMIYLK